MSSFSSFLEMGGYAVIEAANGAQALRACEERQAPIHALVTDVVMPQMSGRELAERVQSLRPEVKVLFVSGYTSDALLRYGVDQGEVAFLQKPFAPGELTHQLKDLLSRSACEA